MYIAIKKFYFVSVYMLSVSLLMPQNITRVWTIPTFMQMPAIILNSVADCTDKLFRSITSSRT